ncbi:MAG: hypothetical protein H6766_06820 [Candidatus Peribacteria bacterium]|nr:MAG: hypothetical protein H6766_06820 [Candidatus Peribacteria bacterium]
MTAATLATGVLSGPTVDVLVSDRLLPTGQQLAVLRQLLTTDIDTISRVWDSVALSYDCERLSADVDIISSCVSGIIDSYHIPPSLLDSLHVWLSDMTQKSVSENTTDTQVEGADVVDDSDITISQ